MVILKKIALGTTLLDKKAKKGATSESGKEMYRKVKES